MWLAEDQTKISEPKVSITYILVLYFSSEVGLKTLQTSYMQKKRRWIVLKTLLWQKT